MQKRVLITNNTLKSKVLLYLATK